jgi:hypothetical protein
MPVAQLLAKLEKYSFPRVQIEDKEILQADSVILC